MQAGILIFFGAMVYHPTFRLKFTKNDKPVPKHAFPVAFTGTVALVIGILLCAHVVERGSEEKSYRVDENFDTRRYWVQTQQTVNDQVFESFSIAQNKPCYTFSISRRAEKYRQKPWHKNWQQLRTMAGVFVGLLGFVMQFVGLRFMNSYAALSQLVAIALMTLCRAIVFPGFTRSFKPAKLVPHFELDWLALTLGKEARLTFCKGAEDGKEEEDTGSEHCIPISWFILPDSTDGSGGLKPLAFRVSRPPDTEAQRILMMRRGLCRLAKVHTTASKCAAKLATAMEEALGILFPNGPETAGATDFRWYIQVEVESTGEEAWIDLLFENNAWEVPRDYLEAAISLWAYNAEAEKGKQKTGQQAKGAENIDAENDGRQRHQSSAQNLDDVSRWMDHVICDLEAWVPHVVIGKMQGKEARRRLNRTRAPSHSQSWQFTDGPSPKRFEMDVGGVDVHATRLLFSFMWSMTKALRGRIMGKVKMRYDVPSDTDEPRHPLWNEVLTRLAMTFAPVSCLTEEDTILEIVSSLSVAGKLPVPRPWFVSLSTMAMQGYRSGDLYSLEDSVDHAKYLVETYGNGPSGVGQRGVAWLLELFHGLTRVLNRFGQHTEKRRPLLEDLREELKIEIRGLVRSYMESNFLEQMAEMYTRQGRQMDPVFHITERPELTAPLDISPLHARAMDLDMDSNVPTDEEASLDAEDICHWSPLHYAAALGNASLAESLVELGADTTLQDLGGFTVAHHAFRSGCLTIIQLLLEKKVALQTQAIDGTCPMHLAAEMGHRRVVGFLLAYKNERDSQLNLRPRDFDGRIPVHYGAVAGHVEIVDMLKADVNEPDDSGWTPLHVAVLAEQTHLIPKLFSLSADGEAKDKRGRTPLVLACSEEKWEALEVLIKTSVERDSSGPSGQTPLHYLAARGAPRAIWTLFEGLQLEDVLRLMNTQDEHGRTPLHLAAGTSNLEIVGDFMWAGADTDLTDHRGETPLFYAIRGACTEDDCLQMIKALVLGGVSLEVESLDGRSAISLAKQHYYGRVTKYLEVEKDRQGRVVADA